MLKNLFSYVPNFLTPPMVFARALNEPKKGHGLGSIK
jgi:hypothetical protein